jgi:hypothetical protein
MDLGNFAVSTLNQYLKGTDFPATKEEVARNAEGNGAPQDLLTQIRNAATERFENPRGGHASAPKHPRRRSRS